MTKRALITGITGQDGSYLAEFLLEKGYEVHGIKRRASLFNTQRIDHIYQDPHQPNPKLKLHYGDLTDTSNLTRIMREVEPDEVYNLGAQSHVAVSFEAPNTPPTWTGSGRCVCWNRSGSWGWRRRRGSIRRPRPSFNGLVQEIPQRETTPFHPRSPYAVAKLYSYWITVNYREAYGMYACNGILFNHESPAGRDLCDAQDHARVGQYRAGAGGVPAHGQHRFPARLGACQGLCPDAVDDVAAGHAEDFVIATGQQYSVREFIRWTAEELGITVAFRGQGVEEHAVVEAVTSDRAPAVKPGQVIMRIDPRYFRPAEVETLLGRPDQGAREAGLDPADHRARDVRRDGGGRPDHRAAAPAA